MTHHGRKIDAADDASCVIREAPRIDRRPIGENARLKVLVLGVRVDLDDNQRLAGLSRPRSGPRNGKASIAVEFAPRSLTPLKRQISKGLYKPSGIAYYPAVLP